MSDDPNRVPNESPQGDQSEWVTGDEPMTGPQRSYLSTLAQEAGVEVPARLTKAAASELIDELQQSTRAGPMISAGDVGALLRAGPEAVLVVVGGRASVIEPAQLEDDAFRGALQVVTRAELISQVGAEELSDRALTEQAAVLDSAVSELGG